MKRILVFSISLICCCPVFATQSLSSVVNYTLATNPSITKEQLLAKISQYNFAEAKGNFLPKLELSGNTGVEQSSAANAQTFVESDGVINNNPNEISVQLSQPIYTGFQNTALFRQKQLELQRQLIELTDVKQSLALQAIEAYLRVIYDKQLVLLAQQNVAVHERNYNKVDKLYHGGAGHKADIDLGEGRLAVARAALQVANINLANDQSLYTEVTGLTPTGLLMPNSVAKKIPANLTTLNGIVLANNYQLKQAVENSAAAHAAIPAAKSAYYPHVNLVLNHSNGENVSGIDGTSQNSSALLVMQMNLFNGGIDYHEVQKTEAESAISISEIQIVQRNLIQESASLWTDLYYSEIQAQQLAAYANASQEVVQGYEQQFAIGKRSLLNVLDVENEFFNAKKQLLLTQLHMQIIRYQLLSLMGQLFSVING